MQSVKKRIKRFFKTLGDWPGTIGLGVGLILVGVFLLERYHASESMTAKLIGLFASELGFACVIAAIIFAMIEEWSAREHCKTAIGHLYGVRPTGYFFTKIEDYVLKQPYYRGSVIVEYLFEKQIGEEVLVRYSVEYDVTNVCTRDDIDDLVIRGSVTKKPLHTGATEWDSLLGVETVTVGDNIYSKDELAITEDEPKRHQSYHVRDRKKLGLHEPLEVKAMHYLVKHDHDAAAWCTTLPCRRAELRLKWDPSIHIKFAAQAIHPEGAKLKEEQGENSLIIKLDEPFLRGHGFHFWWAPESAEPNAAAETNQAALS